MENLQTITQNNKKTDSRSTRTINPSIKTV